jgi:TolA-binding protein
VPLEFVVEGTVVGPGETITAPSSAPARLLFSDRSEIRVAPTSKLAVVGLDARGSRIALTDGSIDVRVRHRPDTAWRFDAGPFTVDVRGTSFHLAFDATRGRLALHMMTGVVEVRGATDARVFTLRAGESLELFSSPGRKPAAEPAQAVEAAAEGTFSPQEAPTAQPPAAPVRRRVPHVEPGEAPVGTEPWPRLIARGDFAAVVHQAERRGLDATVAGASAADLSALADAARYTKRNDLARQALLSLRARFPGTSRASDAAFFLGRLAELTSSSGAAALSWYETYLGESKRGPYTGEALGREIVLLARSDRDRARKAAQTYLERFPKGAQAALAKSLLQSATE